MWRDSARPPRMFGVDARAAFALLLFLLHMSFVTLGIVILAIAAAAVMERRGHTPVSGLRALRAYFAGRHRPITDFGTIVSGATWRRRWR